MQIIDLITNPFILTPFLILGILIAFRDDWYCKKSNEILYINSWNHNFSEYESIDSRLKVLFMFWVWDFGKFIKKGEYHGIK